MISYLVRGRDSHETSRQTDALLTGKPVPVSGKAGGAFGDHPVQPQPLQERAVNANGGGIPQVRGLFRCLDGLHLCPLR